MTAARVRPGPRPTTVDHLLALVFPARCPGCGRAAEPVCDRCLAAASPPVPARPPAGVDRWWAPYAYEGVIRELIARAKYQGRHASLAWLAARMVGAAAVGAPPPDLVTWVPAVAARRRARGIDPVHRLGRLVARHVGVPGAAVLVRHDRGTQTARDLATRRRGPVVTARCAVAGTVLLVDDVATTGATLRACARELRRAGAESVVALTAARTPPVRVRG